MTKNRTLAKELISDIPKKKTARQIQNMDFPMVGAKIKAVVELSVTYQNLSKTIRSTIRGHRTPY